MNMLRTVLLIAVCLLPNIALAQTFNVSTTAQLRTAFENAATNGDDDGAYEYNGSSATVNNCSATLSDSFVLHEPYFTINGSSLWLDLQYAQDAQFPSTDLMFKLSNAGEVTTPADYSNCQASALSVVVGNNYVLNYVVHIPVLILGGTSYWLDLTYVPTSDGLLWFKLTGVGVNTYQFKTRNDKSRGVVLYPRPYLVYAALLRRIRMPTIMSISRLNFSHLPLIKSETRD